MQVRETIKLIYDGKCPLCTLGARKYAPDPTRFELELIDARSESQHPILNEIADAGFDLNLGMVIKLGGKLYHGRQAMRVLAKRSRSNGLARLRDRVLASRIGSKLLYPVFLRIRGASVYINGAGQI